MVGQRGAISKLYPLGFIVLLLFSLAPACSPEKPAVTPEKTTAEDMSATSGKLPDQLFAAHYVDSYPKHGDLFAQSPTRVQLDFNFTLHEASAITVTRDEAPLKVGDLALGPRNLSMWVELQPAMADGLYLVKYSACWPDRSCHPGQFAFTVDGKTRASYLDMTNRKEVLIDMQDITFRPAAIVVSKATKVIWTNRDAVPHFVNTDPHPSHNVLLELNSLDLGEGESYSFTITEPGEWGYHCSAHFPQGMVGRIIVQP